MHELTASIPSRRVAGGYMGNFVCHNSSEFCFVVGGLNKPGIHIEKSAGKCEGVDVIGVDNLNGERNLRIGVAHQVLAELVDVFSDLRVGEQPGRGFHLRGIVLAHSDLALQAIPVAKTAPASDFSITDGVNVADAVVVVSLYCWRSKRGANKAHAFVRTLGTSCGSEQSQGCEEYGNTERHICSPKRCKRRYPTLGQDASLNSNRLGPDAPVWAGRELALAKSTGSRLHDRTC